MVNIVVEITKGKRTGSGVVGMIIYAFFEMYKN